MTSEISPGIASEISAGIVLNIIPKIFSEILLEIVLKIVEKIHESIPGGISKKIPWGLSEILEKLLMTLSEIFGRNSWKFSGGFPEQNVWEKIIKNFLIPGKTKVLEEFLKKSLKRCL